MSQTPWNLCPACGYATDHASEIAGGAAVAKPGDFSVCLDCGEVLRFGEKTELLAATAEDLNDLDRRQLRTVRKAQVLIWQRGRLARVAEEVSS